MRDAAFHLLDSLYVFFSLSPSPPQAEEHVLRSRILSNYLAPLPLTPCPSLSF